MPAIDCEAEESLQVYLYWVLPGIFLWLFIYPIVIFTRIEVRFTQIYR